MTGLSRLSALLNGLDAVHVQGATEDPEIRDVTRDSREAGPGVLMVCVDGATSDGHAFAADAVHRGAAAVVVTRPLDGTPTVPVWRVDDARRALAHLADRVHGHPSGPLRVVGVTGTDGKTTIVNLAASIGSRAGWNPGILGTLGVQHSGRRQPSLNTTPGADRFQRALGEMRAGGSTAAMVEVSSHALVQHRVTATEFAAVVLSNFTRDHLDYHGTVEAYREAKARLFRRSFWEVDPRTATDRRPVAILPTEDPTGDRFAAETDLPVVRYGFDARADWRIAAWTLTAGSSRARLEGPLGPLDVVLRLAGRFNLRNAAAAAAACHALGADATAIVEGLAAVKGVRGRLEPVDRGQPFAVLVDFAHTPDALRTVLAAIREFTPGKVIVVVGAGGDRDRGKRPEMARTVAEGADAVVLTSDNPRSEDPNAILDDLVAGVPDEADVTRTADRAEAVAAAIALAEEGDTVLIAGKGHETEQIVGDQRLHCDDRELALDALARRGYR
jgi:UDP-N-acetylmuramoyl-L-alanyl-D-glutamate--2,6-diaminopimelate ligase